MRTIVSVLVAGCFLTNVAAPLNSIGTVKSIGEFRVDGSTIRGNGTVFEGNLIETTSLRSTVQVGGNQITLLPDSGARIYKDRTVLAKGSGVLREGNGHMIEAAKLQIAPKAKDSVVEVDVKASDTVTVIARSGAAQVRNASGILLAELRPGMGLTFAPQAAGASTSMRLAGTVQVKDGKFLLTDNTTKVTVELRGPDVAKFVGKNVQVTGSGIPGATPAAGASQVVQVTQIAASSGAAGAAGAAGAGAAGAAAAGAAGAGAAAGAAAGATVLGMSVATAAVVGGVATAGVIGGFAASGAFTSNP